MAFYGLKILQPRIQALTGNEKIDFCSVRVVKTLIYNFILMERNENRNYNRAENRDQSEIIKYLSNALTSWSP